jgi:hypothetical protein
MKYSLMDFEMVLETLRGGYRWAKDSSHNSLIGEVINSDQVERRGKNWQRECIPARKIQARGT